ncbi:tRNA (5-methylaminomethyl-2-thiouridine)(34)-methyltransferase MnmD [Bacteroides sp. 519]|uniref:tRNA (5-methylaminomethyl-2-thiouridine)(34)-methyltransferase MnmD n=1 Tax=Bacteroides sp. 519 TaxID=2302937 RepID=UPI0013CFC30C|nr:tRNA (5-methylaminomethyl-2-thiouridine)(34)-methyltransferase MnmD [Bacteroides sp. 519]NDV60381.1 SAM-dependent methyltransferase [Bacteroides sp. 519]
MKRIIEQTADGSSTLYIPEMDEHYHSVKGAATESQHVFINMGMKAHSPQDILNIFEVGFGTGLNAWLTLKETITSKQKVYYTGIELYPLSKETIDALHYTDDPLFGELHNAPWNSDTEITPEFILNKVNMDLASYKFNQSNRPDIVYFDAFAPEKQPEMWTQEIFDSLYQAMNEGGILTTYCAKGVIRRMLQQSGFVVERLPGPPQGKREILRGNK